MTTIDNHTTTHNQKPVEEFAEFIRQRVQCSTKNWWKIALAFVEAQEMYGSDSDSFKRLMKLTNFSKSTVSKLIAVAASERLKTYSEKLSAVLSWGTLYVITTLNDEQFQALKDARGLDDVTALPPFISQPEVEALKRTKAEKSPFKTYVKVQIDEDAVKGDLFTGEDWEALNELINNLTAISEYVKVKVVDLGEKEAASETVRLKNKALQLARREFLLAVDLTLSKYRRPGHEPKSAFEKRSLPMSREELDAQFKLNPREAFALIGREYNEASYYEAARRQLQEVAARRADAAANNALERGRSAVAAVSASTVAKAA